MSDQWTRFDTMESVLLALGGVVLVVGAARIARRRAWRSLCELPPPRSNSLQPFDAALGLVLVLGLPMLVYALVAPAGELAASQSGAVSPSDALPSNEALPSPAQIIASAVGRLASIIGILLIGARRFAGGLGGWGLDMSRLARRCLQAVVAYVAVWPACFGLLHLTVFAARLYHPDFAPGEHSTVLSLLSGEYSLYLRVMTVLSALILAPVSEELLFRGMFQPLLTAAARSPWGGVVLSGAAFGIFHVSLAHTMPALALLGCVLGYLYARTGSLLLVILLHMVFNGKTLLFLAVGE